MASRSSTPQTTAQEPNAIYASVRRLVSGIKTQSDQTRRWEDKGGQELKFVNFLDQALKGHLTDSKERTRALALLSRTVATTRVFPQRLILERIEYHARPKAVGGSGIVHQGIDPSVCVKVMLQVDDKAIGSWIKELVVWAHSSHPNLLPFTGMFFEDNGGVSQICLVSPFMENGNLSEFAPRLSQESRFPLLSDVANGLQFIHGLNIVHSDLKGQNVLITVHIRAVITDFGSSRVTSTTTTATTATASSWTLSYAAPELVVGGEKASKTSDVWSFGCLCYETLSGKRPYYQYTSPQLIAALIRKEPPHRPGVIKDLDQILDSSGSDNDDSDESSDSEEQNLDLIDNAAWSLIEGCCAPIAEERLTVLQIQEHIEDILKQRSNDRLGLTPASYVEIDSIPIGKSKTEIEGIVDKGGSPKLAEDRMLNYKESVTLLGDSELTNKDSSPHVPVSPSPGTNTSTSDSAPPTSELLPGGLLLNADVVSFHYEMDEYWFMMHVLYQPYQQPDDSQPPPAKHLILFRLYQDFYDFQVSLLDTFPREGGRQPPHPRIIPFMPGPAQDVDEALALNRTAELDEYMHGLCNHTNLGARYILEHRIVRKFLSLLPGDVDREVLGDEAGDSRKNLGEGDDRNIRDKLDELFPDRKTQPSQIDNRPPPSYDNSHHPNSSAPFPSYLGSSPSTSTRTLELPSNATSNLNDPPLSAVGREVAFVKIKIFDRTGDGCVAIRAHPEVTHSALTEKIRARLGYDVTTLKYRDTITNTFVGLGGDEDIRLWMEKTAKHVLYAD